MANEIKINIDGMDLAIIAVIFVLGFGGWCDSSKECIDCQPAEADSGPVGYVMPNYLAPEPTYETPQAYTSPPIIVGQTEDPYEGLEKLRAQTQMQLTLETLESTAIDGEIQYEPN